MGRAHVDRLVGFCLHPAAEDATAGKSQSVYAIVTDDGQFQRAVKWRGGYELPLHVETKRRSKAECFDLNQSLYYIFNLLFCQMALPAARRDRQCKLLQKPPSQQVCFAAYYFSGPYNVWVRLPHHRYHAPRPFFSYGSAYYGDPFSYPQFGVCCPGGFILQKRACTPIGW